MDLGFLTRRPIAHRGLHDAATGCIENTLSAVSAAIERDFAIEVDLQLTGDGEAVVFHDETLDRLTTATGRVDTRSLSQLKSITFKATTDHIPSFRELLESVAGRVPLVVEIKSAFARRPDERLATRALDVAAGYDGPLVFMSFDPEVLATLRRLSPDTPRGIVADRASDLRYYGGFTSMERFGLRNLLHIPRTRPHFISYNAKDLPQWGPLFAHKVLGLPLITWTVRSPAERAHSDRYADQITFEGFDPDP